MSATAADTTSGPGSRGWHRSGDETRSPGRRSSTWMSNTSTSARLRSISASCCKAPGLYCGVKALVLPARQRCPSLPATTGHDGKRRADRVDDTSLIVFGQARRGRKAEARLVQALGRGATDRRCLREDRLHVHRPPHRTCLDVVLVELGDDLAWGERNFGGIDVENGQPPRVKPPRRLGLHNDA